MMHLDCSAPVCPLAQARAFRKVAKRRVRFGGASACQYGHVLQGEAMFELIRSNDPVLLSFAESLLKDAGMRVFIADGHMSVLEGSAGFLQRRLIIDEDDRAEATQLMVDAGLGHELRQP
jgi:hypothetical protein